MLVIGYTVNNLLIGDMNFSNLESIEKKSGCRVSMTLAFKVLNRKRS